jgi:hypothetical protein
MSRFTEDGIINWLKVQVLLGQKLKIHPLPPPGGQITTRQKGGHKMSVITVSRQLGSFGTEIAQRVAEKLNYEYLDKEKIEKALADYGLPAPVVERFDEKKPPFWDLWQIQRRKFLYFIQAVIYDFARKGHIVIVGRGGQVLLRDLPGVRMLESLPPSRFGFDGSWSRKGRKRDRRPGSFDAVTGILLGSSSLSSMWTGMIRVSMTWLSIRKNLRGIQE